jgi:hypothetical protein
VHSDRALDQRAEHIMVDVIEALEVEAPLAQLVRTKLLQQLRISALDAAHEVDDEVGLAR